MDFYLFGTKTSQEKGWFKFGETKPRNADESLTESTSRRVSQQQTGNPEKLTIIDSWRAVDMAARNSDTRIRNKLYEMGYRLLKGTEDGGSEWIESLDTDEDKGVDRLRADINFIISGQHAVERYAMRQEQSEAHDQIIAWFGGNSGSVEDKCRYLVDAKMRFGKTFVILNSIKTLGWNKVLVLTYTPEALQEWVRQINMHVNFTDMHIVRTIDHSSENQILLRLPSGKNIILLFASAQDLLDLSKEKFNNIRNEKLDGIIFDEFDFGGMTLKAKKLLSSINSENLIAATGTAFQPHTRNYFDSKAIFTWGYEQEREKHDSERKNSPNEEIYKWLPRMGFYVPEFGQSAFEISKYYDEESKFSFGKFLETKEERFTNETDVKSWLLGIFGRKEPNLAIIKKLRLKHMVWFLPSISSVSAMKKMLRELIEAGHIDKYRVIAISGNDDHSSNSYSHIRNAIKNHHGIGSITLSVEKYSRGVSIPEWDSVFMLYSGSSASSYFQKAFRCQTSFKEGLKTDCYVIDYNVSRILYTSSARVNNLSKDNKERRKDALRNWFDNAPIWSGADNQWEKLDFDEIWLETKRLLKFSKIFNNAFIQSMINPVNLTSDIAQMAINYSKLFGENSKSMKDIAKAQPEKLAEWGQSQESLSGSDPKKSSTYLTKNSGVEEKTIAELVLIYQDIIKDAIKYVFVSQENETKIDDLYNTKSPGLFQEFTSISISDFKKVIDSGFISEDGFNEILLSIYEEEKD